MPQCIVIITALDIEYKAVRNHLSDLREETHPMGNVYERGFLKSFGKTWEAVIVQVRKGDIRAAVQTERAISHFKPVIVLFVGIAGGIKDVKLGDVVVAEKVYGYESGKDGQLFQPRPEVVMPAFRMLERAQAEARKNEWLKRLACSLPAKEPHVFIGPIAAGEKIVASTRSTTFTFLKANYGDALAVEMEGYGFFEAVHANRDIDALVIRGISDLINDKEETDKEGWQERAAQYASAFAIEILSKAIENRESEKRDENKSVSSPLWNIPSRNPYFTGREDILDKIHKALLSYQAAAISQPLAISGLGGIGKTQTAIEYAYRYRQEYTAIFWVTANTQEAISLSFAGIAALLELPEKDEQDQSNTVNAVKRWLEKNIGWLLILDNADEPALIKSLVLEKMKGHILLTSRAQVFDIIGINSPFELDKLEPYEARNFLIRRTGYSQQVEDKAIEELAEELDYLPLALEQAAAYILRTKSSFEAYIHSFRTRGFKLLEETKPLAGDYPKSVATTWLLNFKQVEELSSSSADILRFSAFLNPDMISFDIMISGATELGPVLCKSLTNLAFDPLVLDELLEPLTQFSLIRKDIESRSFSIHRLVQAAIKEMMDRETQRLWAERAVNVLSQAFPTTKYSSLQICDRLFKHVETCLEYIKIWGYESEKVATLFYRSASYLRERTRYVDAEQLYNKALQIFEKMYGTEHEDVAATLNQLAALYHTINKYIEAERLFIKVIAIYKKVYGLNDPMVAQGLHNLAALYTDYGKFREAEQLFKKALEIYEKSCEPDHLAIATTLNSLGTLYCGGKSLADAERCLRKAHEIKEKYLETDDPSMGISLASLALLLYYQKKYDDSEKLLKSALKLLRKAYGINHPDVAQCLNNLAELYLVQGKHAEAEPLFKDALLIWGKVFNPEHKRLAQTFNNLAALYIDEGRYPEAESVLKKAQNILIKVYGHNHPELLKVLNHFVVLHAKMGEAAKASKRRKQIELIQLKNKITP